MLPKDIHATYCLTATHPERQEPVVEDFSSNEEMAARRSELEQAGYTVTAALSIGQAPE
jgi:hypothetical protein